MLVGFVVAYERPPVSASRTILEHLTAEMAHLTGRMPALPTSTMIAIRLARKPDLEFSEVVRATDDDPGLAAQLLIRANSGLYSRGIRITSIQQAAVRLGIDNLRDILAMTSYESLAPPVPRYRSRFAAMFTGALAVARIARDVAGIVGGPADTAFLAGMLHDIGWMHCLRVASRIFSSAVDENELNAAIEHIHADVGGRLADAWKLPPEVAEACRYHHDPGERPMALVVSAAMAVTNALALIPKASMDDAVVALAAAGVPDSRFPELGVIGSSGSMGAQKRTG